MVMVSTISVIKERLNLTVRQFVKMFANCVVSQNKVNRISQGVSRFRELVVNTLVRRMVEYKVNNNSLLCNVDEKTDMQGVANKISEFIKQQKVSGKDFEYLYSKSAHHPTLYSSVYACMTLSMIGRLNDQTANQKLQWIRYFDSFQSDDGLFYDPVVQNEIYADTDWWGARHLALHMISAYTALGGKPKYKFRFLEQYYDPSSIAVWLDAFDWKSSIGLTSDIDNKIMNIGCLLQFQRDTWGDAKAGGAVCYLQHYIKERINPATGMWGDWDVDDPSQLSRMVQFAYHLFPLFFYDKQKLEHSDRIVDYVLKTQNSYGGFGVQANSSACEDIDSIDILCRLASDVPEREKEIVIALQRAWKWVLCNQVEDGGFVFRLYEPFYYGHSEMMSKANDGSMFGTWFRTLSLAYLSRYFSVSAFSINYAPGLEN